MAAGQAPGMMAALEGVQVGLERDREGTRRVELSEEISGGRMRAHWRVPSLLLS
jgi:hypothetical protein